ncbi:hypothetical protein MRX96_059808 [Rhipicephalus microplus]
MHATRRREANCDEIFTSRSRSASAPCGERCFNRDLDATRGDCPAPSCHERAAKGRELPARSHSPQVADDSIIEASAVLKRTKNPSSHLEQEASATTVVEAQPTDVLLMARVALEGELGLCSLSPSGVFRFPDSQSDLDRSLSRSFGRDGVFEEAIRFSVGRFVASSPSVSRFLKGTRARGAPTDCVT